MGDDNTSVGRGGSDKVRGALFGPHRCIGCLLPGEGVIPVTLSPCHLVTLSPCHFRVAPPHPENFLPAEGVSRLRPPGQGGYRGTKREEGRVRPPSAIMETRQRPDLWYVWFPDGRVLR